MKRKISLICLGLAGCLLSTPVWATDLVEAYNDALKSDPTYLAAQSTYHAALQDTPISRAVLLPQLSLGGSNSGALFLNKAKVSDSRQSNSTTTTSKGYEVDLSLTQSIFDFTSIEEFRAAQESVKAAAATYYAALQTLMVSVATDYFAVLQAQENLRYAEANVVSNKSSLTQAQQQYRVGTNTQTDVYTAQAAYSTAVSEQVAAQNSVADAIETLRAVTGKEYKTFSALNKNFPLVSPDPKKVNAWVKVAVENNPALKAAHYTATSAMKTVSAEWGGHLPTVDLIASYGTDYQRQSSNTSGVDSERTNMGSVGVGITLPLFEGGLVTAQTRQAEFNYETAIHNLELEHRTVETSTRVDYLNVLSAISAVQADQTSVKSNTSALRGLEAGYRVGTQTMIDVLNQQSLLYQSEQSYAADRYNYVTNLINLKSDTGTLAMDDFEAINDWLSDAPVVEKSESATQKYRLQTLQNN